MCFVLCTAEAIWDDRLSQNIHNMFMSLTRARQLPFRPRGLSQTELWLIDEELRIVFYGFFTLMCAGRIERLPICRSFVAALLHVVPSL